MRRSSPHESGRLVWRNKLAFVAAAAFTVVLVLGVIVSVWQAIRATQAKHEAQEQGQSADKSAHEALQAERKAEAQRKLAETQRNVAVKQRKLADMQLALQAWEEGDLQRANDWIEASRPAPGEAHPP